MLLLTYLEIGMTFAFFKSSGTWHIYWGIQITFLHMGRLSVVVQTSISNDNSGIAQAVRDVLDGKEVDHKRVFFTPLSRKFKMAAPKN